MRVNGKYICRKQILHHKDMGLYKTYGVFWDDKNFVDDVSCDREMAERIAEILNLYCVDTVHMRDIIEDLIIE